MRTSDAPLGQAGAEALVQREAVGVGGQPEEEVARREQPVRDGVRDDQRRGLELQTHANISLHHRRWPLRALNACKSNREPLEPYIAKSFENSEDA